MRLCCFLIFDIQQAKRKAKDHTHGLRVFCMRAGDEGIQTKLQAMDTISTKKTSGQSYDHMR